MRFGALFVVSVLCSVVHIGCATESSTCDVAAQRLQGCGDAQRESFVSTCEAAGGVDPAAFAASSEAAEVCAASSDGKADAQSAAVGLCVASMYGIKWSIAALSSTPQPLSAAMKTELRPLYGALVDQVRVTIGATLPPEIVIAGHQLSIEPGAMTFGDKIYILQEVADSGGHRLLLTLVHELMHSEQAARNGGFLGFARSYCRQLTNTGYDYEHVLWEDAAYATQEYARQSLARCGHVHCP